MLSRAGKVRPVRTRLTVEIECKTYIEVWLQIFRASVSISAPPQFACMVMFTSQMPPSTFLLIPLMRTLPDYSEEEDDHFNDTTL